MSYGCGRLARTLTRAGLVDEVRVFVAPLVVGSGARLFAEPDETIVLRLKEAKAFDPGTVVIAYEPVTVS